VGVLAFSAFNNIVGSGIFGLPALVAALLGPAAILAYLVCAVLMGLVGLCFAEVGSRGRQRRRTLCLRARSLRSSRRRHRWHPALVRKRRRSERSHANFLTDTLAVSWPVLDGGAPRVLFLTSIYLVLAIVNIRGTRSGARVSVTTALIKLTALILLVIAGAFAIHAPNLHWPGMPSVGSIGQGAVLLLFAFMGIEGDSTRAAKSSIQRAPCQEPLR